MKYSLCALILTITLGTHPVSGQNASTINVNGWLVSNHLGFSTLTLEDSFKVNSQVYGGFAGYEFALFKNYSLTTGVSLDRVSSDLMGQDFTNQHFTTTFIGIPVLFGLQYTMKNPIGFYIKGGVYGLYAIDSNLRIEQFDNDIDPEISGFNFGLQANFGVLLTLSDRVKINLGLQSKSDLFQSYGSDSANLALTNLYAFEFGLKIQSK